MTRPRPPPSPIPTEFQNRNRRGARGSHVAHSYRRERGGTWRQRTEFACQVMGSSPEAAGLGRRGGRMLAVFSKTVARAPEELGLPLAGRKAPKGRDEIAAMFGSAWPRATFFNFSGGSFMAVSHANENPLHPRSVVTIDNVFCVFVGEIENVGDLRRHYGLNRNANAALLIIEIYKVLRDRAPYPSDQVIKDLVGKFAFILYDEKRATLFAARDREGGVKLHWGVTGDGCLVLCDDVETSLDACGSSSSLFPAGCIFMNKTGLASFVHPLYKVRGYTNEDDEGKVSGVYFQVDLYSRLPSIPRVGSAQTWSDEMAAAAMDES